MRFKLFLFSLLISTLFTSTGLFAQEYLYDSSHLDLYLAELDNTDEIISPAEADCYDYSFSPPRYLLELCSPGDSGSFKHIPFEAPLGWKWAQIGCQSCGPQYVDWKLFPIDDPRFTQNSSEMSGFNTFFGGPKYPIGGGIHSPAPPVSSPVLGSNENYFPPAPISQPDSFDGGTQETEFNPFYSPDPISEQDPFGGGYQETESYPYYPAAPNNNID